MTLNTLMRQPDGEDISLIRNAIKFQPAAMGYDQVAGDTQTKPHALGEPASRLAAVKRVKNVGLFLPQIYSVRSGQQVNWVGQGADLVGNKLRVDSPLKEIGD